MGKDWSVWQCVNALSLDWGWFFMYLGKDRDVPPAFLLQILLTCHTLPCRLFVGSESWAHPEHGSCWWFRFQEWWWQLQCCSTTSWEMLLNWPEQSLNGRRDPMAESCAREILVSCAKKKSQPRRAGSAGPVPLHRGVESNPALCCPQHFLLHWLISPWWSEGKQQTWFCPLFSL